MYFKFECSNCGSDLKVDEAKAGLKAKCPYCNATITVPEPPETDEGAEAGDDRGALAAAAREAAGRKGGRHEAARAPHRRSGASTAPAGRGGPRESQLASAVDVSMLKSLGIGVAAAVVFYILITPLRGYYFAELFLGREWVPFVLVTLMGWAVGILVLKWGTLRRQRGAMLLDVLPSRLGNDISPESVDRFLAQLKRVPPHLRDSLMVNRVRRALEHFKVRKSNPEVASLLASQSDIDASAVESSYTMVRVLIWAIPILGFIGTVLGISEAVGGFSGSLDQAEDIEVLKSSLNDVTAGLAIAFDTTLVALAMSILVSFPAHYLQKAEDDLLNWVDEYCNENLLKRLNDAGSVSDVASHTQEIMRSLGAAVASNQAEIMDDFRAVQKGMARVQDEQIKHFETVAGTIEEQTRAIQQRALSHQERVEQGVESMVEQVRSAMEALSAHLTRTADAHASELESGTQAHQEAALAKLEALAEPVGRLAEDMNRTNEEVRRDTADAVREATESVTAYLGAIDEGLTSLNRALKDLGERPVAIPRRSRWWWPFGRRRKEARRA